MRNSRLIITTVYLDSLNMMLARRLLVPQLLTLPAFSGEWSYYT